MVVTTQLRDFIEFCRSFRGKEHEFALAPGLANSFVDTEAAYAAYDAGEYLYAPTGGGASRPADFYGEAMIPEGYVRRHWTGFSASWISSPIGVMPQALIVMQKT